jgi:hypothetical protein
MQVDPQKTCNRITQVALQISDLQFIFRPLESFTAE